MTLITQLIYHRFTSINGYVSIRYCCQARARYRILMDTYKDIFASDDLSFGRVLRSLDRL